MSEGAEERAPSAAADNAPFLLDTLGVDELSERFCADLAAVVPGGDAPLERDVPLIELGMDSMTIIQLLGKLNGEYGLAITDEEMFDEATTANALLGRLREAQETGKRFEAGEEGAADEAAVDGAGQEQVGATVPKQGPCCAVM